MYWLQFDFGGGPKVLCVANHNCVALCIGDVLRQASGVGMVSMMIKRKRPNGWGDMPCVAQCFVATVLCHVRGVISTEAHHLFSHPSGC